MPRQQSRKYAVSLDNPELIHSKFFTEACDSSLPILAISCEMACEAGFDDLIGLYERSPDIAGNICDAARTALRGLQKLAMKEAIAPRVLH